ncbi:hypothetical protein HK104_010398, partial [Borealophlyctis nickersoniae]
MTVADTADDEAFARALYLQEAEAAGSYGYGGMDFDDDDDYRPRKPKAKRARPDEDDDDYKPEKKVPNAKKGKRGRPAKAVTAGATPATPSPITKSKSSISSGAESPIENGSCDPKPGSEVQTFVPAKQPGTGAWTDEEEALFEAGLELYGRNWKKLSEHIGTRDPHAVTSHAQQHFIKLCAAGKEMPDKVKESGEGYTLGGKKSFIHPRVGAATRQFKDIPKRLFSPQALAEMARYVAEKGPLDPKVEADLDAAAEAAWEAKEATKKGGRPRKRSNEDGTGEGADRKVESGKKPKKTSTPSSQSDDSSSPSQPTEKQQEHAPNEDWEFNPHNEVKTAYALARPKRSTAVLKQRHYAEDPLDMQPCVPFRHKFGTEEEDAQPFNVRVHRAAVAMMDLHAHLLQCEVIGYLAGKYDSKTNEIYIAKALPMRDDTRSDRGVTVDADPLSQAAAVEQAEAMGLGIVGWYHSHPVFCTDPSNTDIKTQAENQIVYGKGRAEIAQEATVETAKNGVAEGDAHAACPSHTTAATTPRQSATPPEDSEAEPAVSSLDEKQSPESNVRVASHNGQEQRAESPTSGKDPVEVPTPTPASSPKRDRSNAGTPTRGLKRGMGLEHKGAPFIGAIVGPYNPKHTTSVSSLNWFMVTRRAEEKYRPRALETVLEGHEDMLERGVEKRDVEKMVDLITQSANMHADRTDFGTTWKPNFVETKGEKVGRSLRFWLTGVQPSDDTPTEDVICEGEQTDEGF